MTTELSYTLSRFRWQIVGWGLGVAALGLLIVGFYDTFMEQQEGLLAMLESYPPEFLAFFGGDATSLSTPEGYLGMYGFSMLPVILGIFAVMAGSGLIASDEEGGQLDLMLAYPLSRSAFFLARILALLVASILIIVIGMMGFAILSGRPSLDIPLGTMTLPFIPLLAQILVYSSLALLLSMLLPARKLAAMLAGLVMAVSYVLSSLASLHDGLGYVSQFLPYAYYQGSEAMNGLNLAWLAGLLMASAVFTLLAWWRFTRRDVRVAGEGRWTLPFRRAVDVGR